MNQSNKPETEDFSIVLGGPLFQLLRRAHLTGDGLELLHWRMLILPMVAWLPLLVLSALEGHALGKSVPVPFLLDVAAHVRFLVALPLLILSELVVHQRMRPVVQQFRERHLISAPDSDRFDGAVASSFRLRNSMVVEAMLLVLVFVVGTQLVWKHSVAVSTATWYAMPGDEGLKLSFAGMWYCFLSLPIFQFLLLRWYFRLFVWGRFLWQVSRIDLSLMPTHPDRMGGLGFLSRTAYAFVPLALAHGAMLSGLLATRILYLGAALPQFKAEIALLVVIVLGVVLGPLLVFVPQLARVKRTGIREYGQLAERYVREFESKWLRGQAPADEPFIGSGDIQSLADLGGSFDVVREMRPILVSKEAVLLLVASTLLPIAPLLLTMMPMEELLRKLVGILL